MLPLLLLILLVFTLLLPPSSPLAPASLPQIRQIRQPSVLLGFGARPDQNLHLVIVDKAPGKPRPTRPITPRCIRVTPSPRQRIAALDDSSIAACASKFYASFPAAQVTPPPPFQPVLHKSPQLKVLIEATPDKLRSRVVHLNRVFPGSSLLCCTRCPNILTLSSEAVDSKIETLTKTLARLDSCHNHATTISALVRTPSLLLLNPTTISRKLAVLMSLLGSHGALPPAEKAIVESVVYKGVIGCPTMLASSFGVLGRAGFLRDELTKRVAAEGGGKTRRKIGGEDGDMIEYIRQWDLKREVEGELAYGGLALSRILKSKKYWVEVEGYREWLEEEGGGGEAEHGEILKRMKLQGEKR